MNPAVLDYIRNTEQQQNQPTFGQQQMPGQQAVLKAPPQERYNVFGNGIRAAIESARASMELSQEQKHAALNKSMLAMAGALNANPLQRKASFFDNFRTGIEALGPAAAGYQGAEQAAQAENQAMAEKLVAAERDYRKESALDEDRAWNRAFHNRQLDEQRRYHDLMANSRGDKQATQGIELDGRVFHPLDTIEKRTANKARTDTSNSILALKGINKAFEKLKETSKGNIIDPIGGWSTIGNPAKDFFGQFGNNKALREETAARKTLEAELTKLNVVLERAKTGKGLGQGMYDRLKLAYPDLKNDSLETIKEKLKFINEEATMYNQAANMSVQYGIHIDPNDVDELFSPQQNTVGEETQDLQNPQAGLPNLDSMFD